MLAVLLATEFDPTGNIELDVLPVSAFQPRRRRVNRIATLDGGAAFNDFGYAEADKTITLQWQVRSHAEERAVDALTRQHGRVRVALDGELFLAAIEAYEPGEAESSLRLLVIEKLSE